MCSKMQDGDREFLRIDIFGVQKLTFERTMRKKNYKEEPFDNIYKTSTNSI